MQLNPIIIRVFEKVETLLQFHLLRAVKQAVKPFGKYRFAVILILASSLLMACNNTVEEKTKPIEKSESTTSAQTSSKQVVEIKGMKYKPATIVTNIGDTVLFVNKDLVPHNVTDRENKDTLSAQIDPNEEWMLIVNKNLHFYCSLHPNMEGEIKLKTR